jgi:hypothetical protein
MTPDQDQHNNPLRHARNTGDPMSRWFPTPPETPNPLQNTNHTRIASDHVPLTQRPVDGTPPFPLQMPRTYPQASRPLVSVPANNYHRVTDNLCYPGFPAGNGNHGLAPCPTLRRSISNTTTSTSFIRNPSLQQQSNSTGHFNTFNSGWPAHDTSYQPSPGVPNTGTQLGCEFDSSGRSYASADTIRLQNRLASATTGMSQSAIGSSHTMPR